MTSAFVWTKMGVESGEALAQIVKRKDEERQAGMGIFWWGIGSSLGSAVRTQARMQNGILPIIFSKMLGRARPADSSPTAVWRWTQWEDENGRTHKIPSHVKVISRGDPSKGKHYALVCRSNTPLTLRDDGAKFDPAQCRTLSGKMPGASQVTALLIGSSVGHVRGPYTIAFAATLVEPWAVKLTSPVIL
jgi:hypothetical protein